MGKPIFVLAGQSNAVGLKSYFENSLNEKFGAGGYVLVTVAVGGTPLLSTRSGLDWATPDELPQQLVDDTAAALAANPDGELQGLLWIQGEADTPGWVDATNYRTMLSLLFGRVRGEVDEAAQIPMTVVSLSQHAPARSTRDNWDTIIDQQQAITAEDTLVNLLSPDKVANSVGLATSHMFADSLHYSVVMRALLADAALARMTAVQESASPALQTGTDGDDSLGLGSGTDKMIGGLGNDTYYVDSTLDVIRERRDQGDDSSITSVSFSLQKNGHNVENLVLTGTKDLKGRGNALDNSIIGNSGDNRLFGGKGDDTLRGGDGDDRMFGHLGADLLIGGTGNDRYIINDSQDVIVELGGEGHDRVRASVPVYLRDHSQYLEDLRLIGDDDFNAIGNSQDNLIIGNRGNNRLNGAWGNDWLRGGPGDDRLADSNGDDIYSGGAGSDLFVFELDAGHDRVKDFTPDVDKLVFIGVSGLNDLKVSGHAWRTLIEFGDDAVVRLDRVAPHKLDADDFLFV